MATFSERIGAAEAPKTLQINGMNAELQNSLWNFLYSLYQDDNWPYWRPVAKFVAENFQKTRVDELPSENYKCRTWLKDVFFGLPWYRGYDLVEFIVNNHVIMIRLGAYQHTHYHPLKRDELISRLNDILQRELSAYRFIAGVLSPISDKMENDAITIAIKSATEEGLDGAREHLVTALMQLGKKPQPDYRNCIKEAISAVESVTKQISGSKSKGLDGALEELSKVTEIHGALKSAFKSLYGYSSDEEGIRHAILEQPNVGFAEAKYMLVACAAFVYYLIQKADDAKMIKSK